MRLASCLVLAASLAPAQIPPDRHNLPSGSPAGSKAATNSSSAPQQGSGQQGSGQQGSGQQGSASGGFTIAARSGNVGQALNASFSSGPSAKAAFRTAIRQVSAYFDRPPQLLSGAGDAADTQIQATFKASFNNTPVAALMQVSTNNGRASAMLFFDRQDLLRQSLPAMAKQVEANAPKAAGGGPAQLTRTPLPDKSGFIGLAPGWRIATAYKGEVQATGPNGEALMLGASQHVFPRGNYPKVINGPYLQPWPALQAYEDAIFDHALSQGRGSIRMLEQAPVQARQGQQSAYISFEITVNGKASRGLANVLTSPFNDDLRSWFFYMSIVVGPAAQWTQSLPTMWEMWKSWTVNQEVYRERMESAIKSMHEITQIILDTNAARSHAFDNHNYGWTETFRGVTMIEDTITKERAEVDTNYAQKLVEEANAQGYKWRIVPVDQLIP
ncbi:MAG TPA: hypothetical protein VN841_20840 [Bryobacteraceae bacterium]|nr:hypothetical protein [Bryobacteraceae bacterium]